VTAPKPNAELAYQVLDQIDAEPERWYQGSWVRGCGTSYCFAGWALALTDHTLRDYEADGCRRMELDGQTETYSDTVSLAAAHELGLNHWVAEGLFEPDHTREDLGRLVTEIFGPRPTGTGCRCDWLGEGTPEHTPSPLCRSLRPDADRDGAE
jgi:hypothetical protein